MSTEPTKITGHFCGQAQPHAAHIWQTPPVYGTATVISTYQCGGLLAPAAEGERDRDE